ncbi:MAG: succinate dehydrogenase cytochrome b subunit [Proteobacteria bacterium]|nr:succinate dehydrogenase cytochrome b subunit [Pseudomonadota bacterium]MBU4298128.1 succinate dehydrogenase cytochrome b subunit [Pseudomonadota bacterium]
MTLSQTVRSSVGQKILMAVSGAMLSLFLLVHGIGNSTTFFGSEAFNAYAEKLHSLGVLVQLFELGLLAVFLLHISLGLSLFLQNNQSRPVSYEVEKSSGGRTLGSRSMPYTGVVILIFLVVHLVNFHFTDHSIPISDIVKNVLRQPLYALFYISAMIVLALHISHGFWSLFQSLGLNHPKYNGTLRNGTLGAALLLSAVFILIPLCTLLIKKFLL